MSTKRAITQLLKDKERIEKMLRSLDEIQQTQHDAVDQKHNGKREDYTIRLRALDGALEALGYTAEDDTARQNQEAAQSEPDGQSAQETVEGAKRHLREKGK